HYSRSRYLRAGDDGPRALCGGVVKRIRGAANGRAPDSLNWRAISDYSPLRLPQDHSVGGTTLDVSVVSVRVSVMVVSITGSGAGAAAGAAAVSITGASSCAVQAAMATSATATAMRFMI